jgi:tellurite resistance protein
MPGMSVDIGRDTLVALAAVAWADGRIDPAEAAGIRSAASQLGLDAGDLKLVEDALSRHVALEEVETVRMSRLTRLFTFAVGTWIAHIDGQVPKEEQDALNLLGDRLGLSSVARQRAESAALAIARASQSGHFDVFELRSKLSAGLSQIGDE